MHLKVPASPGFFYDKALKIYTKLALPSHKIQKIFILTLCDNVNVVY
jgi:hypothetical protein